MKFALLVSSVVMMVNTAFAGNTKVELDTSEGKIVLELEDTKAPITTKNFINYVKEGHYNGTVFHRVIDGFMIQGGGFKDGAIPEEKSTGKPIKNESSNGLTNAEGTIAMARTSDPDSATAQFFINVKDNTFLDGQAGRPGYAVFGKVVTGMDVVNKIKSVTTGTKDVKARGMGGDLSVTKFKDVPMKNVVIKTAKVVDAKPEAKTKPAEKKS